MRSRMRYKIVLEYDGSAFHGWQRQIGLRTVQGEAERALSHIAPGASVTASGRTDEGVHALGQVAHFDYFGELDAQTLARALNHWLPEDISVVDCSVAPDSFDARKSAKRKTYEYVMYTSPVPSPLRRTRECRIGDRADVAAMNAAASRFIGTHDFSAFMTSGSSAKTFTRTIYSSSVTERDGRMVFRITGSGFLYNMVRIMAGALMRVGRGEKREEDIERALSTGDRRLMPDVAPPEALYLVSVEYDGI